MTPKQITDRDLLVFLIVAGASVAISVTDTLIELVDPARGFVDFAILFSYGWGLYTVGKMPP